VGVRAEGVAGAVRGFGIAVGACAGRAGGVVIVRDGCPAGLAALAAFRARSARFRHVAEQ
jgi:hypothetical protein